VWRCRSHSKPVTQPLRSAPARSVPLLSATGARGRPHAATAQEARTAAQCGAYMPPESAQQTRASVPGPRMPGKLSASSVGAKKSARRRNRAAVSASEWRRRVQLRTSRACRAGRAHTPGVGAAHVYQSSSSGQNTATCAPSARSPSTATCTAGPALGTVQHKCTWAAATSTAPPRRCMRSPSQQFQCEKAGRQAAEGTACSVTLRAAGCIAVPARPSAWHAGWRQTAHVYMPVGRLGAHLRASVPRGSRGCRAHG